MCIRDSPFVAVAVAAGGRRLVCWGVQPASAPDGACHVRPHHCARAQDQIFDADSAITSFSVVPDDAEVCVPFVTATRMRTREGDDGGAGGGGSSSSAPMQPCLVTGHADGRVRFWTLRRGVLARALSQRRETSGDAGDGAEAPLDVFRQLGEALDVAVAPAEAPSETEAGSSGDAGEWAPGSLPVLSLIHI